MIRQVLEMRKDPTLPELRFSTLRDFFTAIEAGCSGRQGAAAHPK
jgi:hypothetical protein